MHIISFKEILLQESISSVLCICSAYVRLENACIILDIASIFSAYATHALYMFSMCSAYAQYIQSTEDIEAICDMLQAFSSK